MNGSWPQYPPAIASARYVAIKAAITLLPTSSNLTVTRG